MPLSLRTALSAFGVTSVLLLVAPTSAEDKPGQPTRPNSCVTWKAVARPSGYAYDHVVQIHNGCERAAYCSVSTNVNSEVQVVSVAAKSDTDVVTFRGSPAREFTPSVDCQVDGKP